MSMQQHERAELHKTLQIMKQSSRAVAAGLVSLVSTEPLFPSITHGLLGVAN